MAQPMAERDRAPDETSLENLIDRLERAADQLRSGELTADAAASLVEDCAALATAAGAELDRRAREAAAEPIPGQGELL
jgi:exonuclease VII small subunit